VQLYLKALAMLWAINTAPLVLAYFLEGRWKTPLDLGKRLPDGKPLFGPHKTIRGAAAGILTGGLVGMFMGIPFGYGIAAGLLGISGDLLSSFIKRRLDLQSGTDVPGLDQFIEGLFPLVLLQSVLGLSSPGSALVLLLFCITAYLGSQTYKSVLLALPDHRDRRPDHHRTRFKEFASCRLRSPFLRRFLNFEDAIYYHLIIKSVFKVLGLYKRGMANALDFRVQTIRLKVDSLPARFEGFTIMLLTDLHLDGFPALADRLREVLPTLEADLCILGGDYRMSTHGPCDEANYRMRTLVDCIRTRYGTVAVLGNHDCLVMADVLEECGVNVLLNSNMVLEREGERLWVAGVDDPHYYHCHDVRAAMESIPREGCTLFISHTPRLYKEAARAGASVYLTGHTHAGQVQIPPFGLIFTHTPAPRRICQGEWSFEGMVGYTSAGVGVSGVPVRFNCRGEVALITLSGSAPDLLKAGGPKTSQVE
jgi:uncharacterized protein